MLKRFLLCFLFFAHFISTALITAKDEESSFQKLSLEILKLKAKVSNLEKKCGTENVQNDVHSLKDSVASLTSSNKSLSEDTISLKNDFTEFDQRLAKLERKQSDILFKLKTIGQSQTSRTDYLETALKTPSGVSGINRNASSIAFYAVVSDVLTNLKDDDKIPFGTKFIDTAGSFYGSEGIFICPRTGVYVFFTTILTYPGVRLEYNIVKNGFWFAAGYTKGDLTSNTFDSGTTPGIVFLEQGDQVWVQLLHKNGYEGDDNMVFKEYSSFMGFSLTLV